MDDEERKPDLHYKCTKIAEQIAKESKCKIDLNIVCLATELLFRFYQVLATDLEAFAHHAKRSTVQVEDVFCFVRRNPQLVQTLTDLYKQNQTVKPSKNTGSNDLIAENNDIECKNNPKVRPKALRKRPSSSRSDIQSNFKQNKLTKLMETDSKLVTENIIDDNDL